MSKHNIRMHSGLWYAFCGHCPKVFSGKYEYVVESALERHCARDHARVTSVDA